MSIALNDRVAVVTGAARGIGRAIAIGFAQKGAAVVVNDRDRAGAEAVRSFIEDIGGLATVSCESVAEWPGASRIVDAAMDVFGRVDIVVNNAGIVNRAPFAELDPSAWREMLAVHLDGSFYVSRAAAPHFTRQRGGSLIHMTSAGGLIGFRGQAHYCAAKMGIVGLSRALALELAEHNIRSNCIAPYAATDMSTAVARSGEKIQIDNGMTPETIVPICVYLAADASAAVSGQIFIMRRNELFLAGQGFPLSSVHNSNGWTADTIAGHAMPALSRGFLPLLASNEVITWPPV